VREIFDTTDTAIEQQLVEYGSFGEDFCDKLIKKMICEVEEEMELVKLNL
jgi:hypothetical protein